MSGLGYSVRNYNLSQVKQDPILYLSQLLGLDSEIGFIRQNSKKALPILSGLIVYRQLGHIEKQQVLRSAQNLGNSKFFGKVQALVAILIANPRWNNWCLSDSELKALFKTNKAVSGFLATYFLTVDGKLEAGIIASTIVGIASDGVTKHITSQLGKPIAEAGLSRLKLSQGAVQTGSQAFLIAVVVASVMKKFTEIEAKNAKEELFRRGLLKVGDL
ncbi:hypothetical protein [Psychromonas antarctica]|uniref:hypothetical protein n=1 Tax=Psychromonas antarctica TaxID=67573 RepID=UPI001EE8A007|nr:hypothetical protein [Psychromonas antarctica]MCG6202836.1 hypothetical protein [Psychromonas antarctica]